MKFVISETAKIEPLFYDWGALKWVCNDKIAPGCGMSFGLVNILPGRTNPEHWHTEAQEIVYMLSGECDIKIDGTVYKLTPGQTLFIPENARHSLTNSGWEPVVYVASFSAAFRGTVSEDPNHPGARPRPASGY